MNVVLVFHKLRQKIAVDAIMLGCFAISVQIFISVLHSAPPSHGNGEVP